MAALERIRAAVPAGDRPSSPTRSGATSGPRPPVRRRPVRRSRGGRGHGQPVPRREAIAPLLERADRFAYVLCRTSNPGAGELQDLRSPTDPSIGAPAEPLHRRVARRASRWGPGGTVGLVVGRDRARRSSRGIRAIVPGLAFLVPGVGAQGGEVEPVLEHGPATACTGRRPSRGRPPGQRLARHRRGRHRRLGTAVRRPLRACRGRRRRLGQATPCATLAAALQAPRSPS